MEKNLPGERKNKPAGSLPRGKWQIPQGESDCCFTTKVVFDVVSAHHDSTLCVSVNVLPTPSVSGDQSPSRLRSVNVAKDICFVENN